MVTIPDEVKALFSSDTVRKNFHVTFPNGEYTDLNNENILSESVSFTESLCSQQYFKFGLAEASQIEFTAVGIPNVRGAYIECAIEIDCTRLGAAWANDNPVDPTLDFLTPQTCNYNGKLFYRVPYGRFKIDTCPRDHGAMWQRKITAYSDALNASESFDDSFEVQKQNTLIPFDSTYQAGIYQLFAALVNKKSFFNRPEWETTALPKSPSSGQTPWIEKTVTVYLENDNTAYDLRFVSNYFTYSPINDGDLGSFETDRDVAAERSAVFESIKNDCGIDWVKTIEGTDYATADEFLDALLTLEMFYPTLIYSQIKSGAVLTESIVDTKPNSVFFPKIGNKWGFLRLRFPQGVYDLTIGNYPYAVEKRYDYDTGLIVNRHVLSSGSILDGLTVTFNSTLKQSVYNDMLNKKVSAYSFANAFSLLDYIKGQLELVGWFLKPSRYGDLDFFQMSENPTAISVSASDWSSFWWDETPIDAIGQVKVIYADAENNEEQQQTFEIGDGNSIYTIENNEVLKAAEMDKDSMQEILDTYFAPNASVVNFTPTDLEMRGLPYLESGDYIELTAEDGETVETYILSQTINGIQHLTASITSTNGALLEVIDNE